jgi:hypothetical protein
MTVDEAFEACRHRLVVRDRTSGYEGSLVGLEWGIGRDEETLMATIGGGLPGRYADVLDLDRVHPDDAR